MTNTAHPADLAAREAFRAFCDTMGGANAFADAYSIAPQTARRMYRGDRRIPPGIARTIAAFTDKWGSPEIATAMQAWIAHNAERDQRA